MTAVPVSAPTGQARAGRQVGWQVGDPSRAILAGPPPGGARTLIEVLAATCERFPDAPALDDGIRCLTYAELATEVARRVARLRECGIGPGDRVAIIVPAGQVFLHLAILAVLASGAAYVPIDADDPAERAGALQRESGAVAVLTGETGEALDLLGVPLGLPSPARPRDDAWIIFTSGSTGTPKGVAVTHASAAAFVDAEAELFCTDAPLGPGDRVLAGLSVGFDASCEEMWLAWRHGACLVPASRQQVRAGAELGPWLRERAVNVVSTVPTLAALWSAEDLAGVRLLILGGEACSSELAQRLSAPVREVWNTYGPTETTVVALAGRLDRGGPVRIGLPLAGWTVAVLGDDGLPVVWGEQGELAIGGLGVARYLDSARDVQSFRDVGVPELGTRVYLTGDLVRADRAGLLFLGRADDQVKIGGRRVELGEVDAALSALPGVRAAATAIRTTTAGTTVLAGWLVPEAGLALDLPELRKLLTRSLPAGIVPTLRCVDALPMRPSGKVDRAALPWSDGADIDAAALTSAQADLARAWSEVLGHTDITPATDFFAAGGSSLAVAHLISALRLDVPGLSVADLYRHPTLATMADRIDAVRAAGRATASAATARTAPTELVPRRTGLVQAGVLLAIQTWVGLRWVLAVAALLGIALPSAVPGHPPLWVLVVALALVASPPASSLLAVAGCRVLLAGLAPGSYPRGGRTHLRVWAAGQWAAACGLGSVLGTPWAPALYRLLGCRVGRHTVLLAMPPLTGLASFGDGCSVEAEADLSGWWVDGDIVRVGELTVGAGARVGARAVLMPGAVLGADSELDNGACLSAVVLSGQRWTGSPARPVAARTAGRPVGRPLAFTITTKLGYAGALCLLTILPLCAAVPAAGVFLWKVQATPTFALPAILLAAPLLTVFSLAVYGALVAITVRVASRLIRPGAHPADGSAALATWLVHRLMATTRGTLFGLHASLLTPAWLRLLGTGVGSRVEVSTVLALPSLVTFEDESFLADDTLVAAPVWDRGLVHLATSTVGRRAFVGNSGQVAAGRCLPAGSLVGVLSAAPAEAAPGSSWLGLPPIPMTRAVEAGADEGRTFRPSRVLVLRRAAIEVCRLVPLMLSLVLADVLSVGLALSLTRIGIGGTLLVAPLLLTVLGVVACALASAVKWLLVGRYRMGCHPLWSGFVWRTELSDCFIETLGIPWLGHALTGTPMLCVWLRTLGARIGRGVWCESWWLPEADLVELGDGATVNRGCVIQTHLFHDRLMRLGPVKLGPGASLGPHSITLPESVLERDTRTHGSCLVMRGETLPAGRRWAGNPVTPE